GPREWPDVGPFVAGIADPVGGHDVDQRGDERVPNGLVRVHPLGGTARLPTVVERALGDRERGFLDVDVVRHICRVLAAELELDAHEPLRGRAGDPSPGRVRAGEADEVDVGLDQRGAGGAATHDRVHDVDRHTRTVEQVYEAQTREGGVLRRLVTHGVADEERRDDRVEPDEVRVIPRADVRDDADGLVSDALVAGDGARLDDSTRMLDVPIDAFEHRAHLVARLPDRLAHLARRELRALLG